MFYSLQYRYKKWRLKKRAAKTPLKALLDTSAIDTTQSVSDTRFLVVDCEMSGLDVNSCQLLSIGWVVIENNRLVNSRSRHLLIHADRGAGDSTRIHGLHDASIAGAKSAASVLTLLIKQMVNSVLVFHHAPIDIRFLQKTAYENYRCPLLFPYLDTMALEKRRLAMQGKHEGLRLAQCRERYGLASVTQHNALADARATAELLLAQISHLGNADKLLLGRLDLRC